MRNEIIRLQVFNYPSKVKMFLLIVSKVLLHPKPAQFQQGFMLHLCVAMMCQRTCCAMSALRYGGWCHDCANPVRWARVAVGSALGEQVGRSTQPVVSTSTQKITGLGE
jgi:hypothetical protein